MMDMCYPGHHHISRQVGERGLHPPLVAISAMKKNHQPNKYEQQACVPCSPTDCNLEKNS